MKFNKKKKTEILEGDLTPMIDMTFQLIAFFMLLINFSEAEVSEKILLPSSELAVPPTEPPEYQIILNLEPNETITFAGQKIRWHPAAWADPRTGSQQRASGRMSTPKTCRL